MARIRVLVTISQVPATPAVARGRPADDAPGAAALHERGSKSVTQFGTTSPRRGSSSLDRPRTREVQRAVGNDPAGPLLIPRSCRPGKRPRADRENDMAVKRWRIHRA